MSCLRPGDTFVDVGAYIGLYAVVAARRVGPKGRVIAFEPVPESQEAIRLHASINKVRVDVVGAAVGAREGHVMLSGSDSEVQTNYASNRVDTVPCVTLDSYFTRGRIDVLKVDVEGFEEEVLRGASRLLSSSTRRPRVIFIEVHPFAWTRTETTSESLLGVLRAYGYKAQDISGSPLARIERYGEIVARPLAE